MLFAENSNLNNAVFGKWQDPIAEMLVQHEEAMERQRVYDLIFCESPSTHYAESYTDIGGLDDFAPTKEGGETKRLTMEQGHAKTIENITFTGGFEVTREMVEDGMSEVFQRLPQKFNQAWARTCERTAAAILGTAINVKKGVTIQGIDFDCTAADGLTMFHGEHKNKRTGKKQSNCFSNGLSSESISLVETAMQNLTGDNDEELGINPCTLIIPNDPAMKKAAIEIIKSLDDPTGSTRKFNYQYERWNLIVWPYLNRYCKGDNKPWIMMDGQFNKTERTAIWQVRNALEVTSWVDRGNRTNHWDGYARVGAGFKEWRGMSVGGISGATTLV